MNELMYNGIEEGRNIALSPENNTSKKEITDNTKMEIKEALKEAHSIDVKIDRFSEIMDRYGLDAILSFLGFWIPTAIISTTYLLRQWKKIGIPRSELRKIVGYWAKDVLIGGLPIIGGITDYLYKGNQYSAELFAQHLTKLEEQAIKDWLPPETIEELRRENENALTSLAERARREEMEATTKKKKKKHRKQEKNKTTNIQFPTTQTPLPDTIPLKTSPALAA